MSRYSPVPYHNFQEAGSALTKDTPPYLIISDVNGMGGNGINFAKTHNIPTILITGREENYRRLDIPANVIHRLVKPFNPQALVDLVDRAFSDSSVRSIPVHSPATSRLEARPQQ
jgi:DNA-binding NtrC family response regulator